MSLRFMLYAAIVTASAVSAQQPGFIHGTVVSDSLGGVIQRVAITVSSPEDKCETRTDGEGRFNCRLKPGRYKIAVLDPLYEVYERATMEVKADAHVFVRLRLIGNAQAGLAAEFLKPPEEASVLLRQRYSLQSGGDAHIQASSRTMQANETLWKGPHLVVTIGTLAVYADQISCSEPLHKCQGTGSVRIENGNEDLLGDQVEIDLDARTIQLTRAPTIVRTF